MLCLQWHILAAPLSRQKCVFHNILEFRTALAIDYKIPPTLPLESIPWIKNISYLTNDNFKILDTANNESDLRILESLYVFYHNNCVTFYLENPIIC